MVHAVCRHVQHMHICGNQRIIGVFLYVGSFTEPKAHLGQATNHQPETCLSLPFCAGVLGTYILAWLFTWVQGTWTQVVMLAERALLPTEPLPPSQRIARSVVWQTFQGRQHTHHTQPITPDREPTMDQNVSITKIWLGEPEVLLGLEEQKWFVESSITKAHRSTDDSSSKPGTWNSTQPAGSSSWRASFPGGLPGLCSRHVSWSLLLPGGEAYLRILFVTWLVWV